MNVTLGILFVFVIGSYLPWQWFSFICACIPLLGSAALLFVPESPNYLLVKRNHTAARASLQWLRGEGVDITAELNEKREAVEGMSGQVITMRSITSGSVMKPLLISLGCMFYQQVSGINNVIFYTHDIFEAAGSSMTPALSSIIVGIVQVSFKPGRLNIKSCMLLILLTIKKVFKA